MAEQENSQREFDGYKGRFTALHHGEDGRMCIWPGRSAYST